MFEFLKANLQLFADSGEAAAATGAEQGENISTVETSTNVLKKSSTAGRKNINLSEVKYGKQETLRNVSEMDEEQSQAQDLKEPEKNDLSFDELIRSDRYKEDYQKSVEKILNQRLKKFKGMESALEEIKPVMELAGKQYGLNPNDDDFVSKLSSAMSADDRFFEKMALEKGYSIDEAKRVYSLEQKIAELSRQRDEQKEKEAFEKQWGAIIEQSQTTKQQFPNFDLNKEMQNDKFAKLVFNGVDTTAAFIATNHRNIIPATVQMATEKAVQQTVNAVKANKSRPSENGLSSQATAIIKDDPSKLKLADFKQIMENIKKTGVRPKF